MYTDVVSAVEFVRLVTVSPAAIGPNPAPIVEPLPSPSAHNDETFATTLVLESPAALVAWDAFVEVTITSSENVNK